MFAYSGWAQDVLVLTNGAPVPEPDIANPDHIQTVNAGSFRLNLRVTDGPGGAALDMSDITTFSATIKDLTDGRIAQTVTQDTTGENIDASQGQVRFVFSSLLDRGITPDYEVEAWAIAPDTNQNYRIHWGYLSVTSAPASGSSASFSFIDISANTITANYISASDGVFGNVSFTNSISTIDSLARTSSVLKVGDTMTGPMTNEAGLYGNAVGLTNFSVTAIDVSVAYTPTNYTDAADVEGHLVEIDSALTSIGGGLSYWSEEAVTDIDTGAFFQVASPITTNLGFFVDAAGNIAFRKPDGTLLGGNALSGSENIDFTLSKSTAAQVSLGTLNIMAGGQRHQTDAAADRNAIIGGDSNYAVGDDNAIIGAKSSQVGSGSDLNLVSGDDNDIGVSSDRNVIAGGRLNDIDNSVGYSFVFSSLSGNIDDNSTYAGIIGGFDPTISSGVSNAYLVGGVSYTLNRNNTWAFPNLEVLLKEGYVWITNGTFVVTDHNSYTGEVSMTLR